MRRFLLFKNTEQLKMQSRYFYMLKTIYVDRIERKKAYKKVRLRIIAACSGEKHDFRAYKITELDLLYANLQIP